MSNNINDELNIVIKLESPIINKIITKDELLNLINFGPSDKVALGLLQINQQNKSNTVFNLNDNLIDNDDMSKPIILAAIRGEKKILSLLGVGAEEPKINIEKSIELLENNTTLNEEIRIKAKSELEPLLKNIKSSQDVLAKLSLEQIKHESSPKVKKELGDNLNTLMDNDDKENNNAKYVMDFLEPYNSKLFDIIIPSEKDKNFTNTYIKATGKNFYRMDDKDKLIFMKEINEKYDFNLIQAISKIDNPDIDFLETPLYTLRNDLNYIKASLKLFSNSAPSNPNVLEKQTDEAAQKDLKKRLSKIPIPDLPQSKNSHKLLSDTKYPSTVEKYDIESFIENLLNETGPKEVVILTIESILNDIENVLNDIKKDGFEHHKTPIDLETISFFRESLAEADTNKAMSLMYQISTLISNVVKTARVQISLDKEFTYLNILKAKIDKKEYNSLETHSLELLLNDWKNFPVTYTIPKEGMSPSIEAQLLKNMNLLDVNYKVPAIDLNFGKLIKINNIKDIHNFFKSQIPPKD